MTPRQRRFVEEYLTDCNATQAAARAGYSSATARQMGSENLSKPVIQREIEARLLARAGALAAGQQDLVGYLARLLDASICEIFDERNLPLPVREWPLEFQQLLVKKVRVQVERSNNGNKVTTFSIEFTDRIPLLLQMGRLVGAWR